MKLYFTEVERMFSKIDCVLSTNLQLCSLRKRKSASEVSMFSTTRGEGDTDKVDFDLKVKSLSLEQILGANSRVLLRILIMFNFRWLVGGVSEIYFT